VSALWADGRVERFGADAKRNAVRSRVLFKEEVPVQADEFGGLLLERKEPAGVWFAIGWPLAALCGGAGVLGLDRDVTIAAVLWAMTGLCLLVPLFLPGRRLRFHETGLVDTAPLRAPFRLPYERVERMTWGAYKPHVGATVRATLVAGGRRIAFIDRMDTGGRYQYTLERVRDAIASHMAIRLHARVQADEPVAWGSPRDGAVQIARRGLSYRPIGFLGKGEERVVPWSTPIDYVFRNGFLTVVQSGTAESLFTLSCAAPDFYPCFLVFASMGCVRKMG
jgi:hypothetical protein